MPSGHDSCQVKILASSLWCFTPRLRWARGNREKISKGKDLTQCNQGKISRPRPPPEENRAKRRTKKRGSSLASQPGSNERMLCHSMHTLKKKEPGGARHATHSSVGDGLWEGWPVPPFGTAKIINLPFLIFSLKFGAPAEDLQAPQLICRFFSQSFKGVLKGIQRLSRAFL